MGKENVMGGKALKVVLIAVALLAPIASLYQLAGTSSRPAP